jgi:hypothetical protein
LRRLREIEVAIQSIRQSQTLLSSLGAGFVQEQVYNLLLFGTI